MDPQAAGEIAALRLCRQPDSEAARVQVDQLLNGECFESNTVEGLRGWISLHVCQSLA